VRIADLIVRAGRVVPEAGTAIENGAVAVADGRVIGVGTAVAVDVHRGQVTRVIDVPGGVVLPGLADAHGHLVSFGESLEALDLVGTRSVEEVVERARRAAEALPEGAWLSGRGWDQNDWPEGAREFPDRVLLDAALGDRPVVLERIDGHAAWASSAALAAAGIDERAPDPPDGRLVRRPDGTATGVLVDGAMSPLSRAVPGAGDATIRRRAVVAARELARLGHTALHDMGSPPHVADVLLELGQQGALGVRVHVYLDGGDPAIADALSQGPRRSGLVAVTGVKFLLDGALGSRGAALFAPYADDPANSGMLLWDPEVLRLRARAAMQRGFSVAVHAIGDRANRIAIEVLGALARELPVAPHPRIEHAQVLAPEDIPRLGASGLVASMQPLHCTSDMPWAPSRLGPDRLTGAYAWRSLLRGGALLAFGSDCPVERPDPLAGLYAAVTRRSPTRPRASGPYPPTEERLDLALALAAFTRGAAAAVGEGDHRGTLRVGADADLTVLAKDPFAPGQPAEALLEAPVAYTIVGGRVSLGE
jgi:predicted amidohydrolase YtcJ